jgi:hypothetical protein
MSSPLLDKNFYLLSLLDKDPAVRSVIINDKELAAIATERQRYLTYEKDRCKDDVVCLLKPLVWTEEEIEAASLSLARLYKDSSPLQHLVDSQLRASGAYEAFAGQSGADLLMGAWRLCAHGLNEVVSVYGEGQPPRYPLIDSISLDAHSTDYRQQIDPLIARISQQDPASAPFFAPSLTASLELLRLNHRDEAARLEPMEAGVNEPAVRHIAGIHWQQFQYSVIIVPGAGPGDRDTALSGAGRKRTELAAQAYRSGLAPVIILSGGYVHPAQTRFAEALEMKKLLVNELNVPETAVLVDPHARHTTTNLRNAVREIYRYGAPMNKPALVISDTAQIDYIASQQFADRCLKEMGYLPYQFVGRPSATSLAFMPEKESLEQDPMDPLDP